MQNYALIYPMFAMVAVTVVTLLRLFRTRALAVREGRVDASYFSTYQEGSEPEAAAQLARHFSNLFEAPTLFYVACVSAMVTDQSTTFMLILAWLYVVLRIAHTYIHTGSNRLTHRIAAYFSSWAALLLMWTSLVVGVASRSS